MVLRMRPLIAVINGRGERNLGQTQPQPGAGTTWHSGCQKFFGWLLSPPPCACTPQDQRRRMRPGQLHNSGSSFCTKMFKGEELNFRVFFGFYLSALLEGGSSAGGEGGGGRAWGAAWWWPGEAEGGGLFGHRPLRSDGRQSSEGNPPYCAC